MKIKNVQSKLFKALTAKNVLVSIVMCGTHEIITPDGCVGYVLPPQANVFDMEKIRRPQGAGLKVYDKKKDKPLRMTRAATFDYNGRIAQRFEADTFATYINPQYLKAFDDYRLFARSPIEPVFVMEDEQLVGIICPVRVTDGAKVEMVAKEADGSE